MQTNKPLKWFKFAKIFSRRFKTLSNCSKKYYSIKFLLNVKTANTERSKQGLLPYNINDLSKKQIANLKFRDHEKQIQNLRIHNSYDLRNFLKDYCKTENEVEQLISNKVFCPHCTISDNEIIIMLTTKTLLTNLIKQKIYDQ